MFPTPWDTSSCQSSISRTMTSTLNESSEDTVINVINLKNISPNQSSAASINICTNTNNTTRQTTTAKNNPKPNGNLPKNKKQTSSSSSSSTCFSPGLHHAPLTRVDINFGGTNYKVPGFFTLVDKKTIQEWARNWKQGLLVTDIRSVKSMPRNQPPLALSMKDMCRWFHNNVYSESPLLLGRVDGQQGKEKPKYVKIFLFS